MSFKSFVLYFGVLLFFSELILGFDLEVTAKEFEIQFHNEFQIYKHTNQVSENLAKLVNIINDRSIDVKITDIPKALRPHICLLCRVIAYVGLKYNETSGGHQFISDLSISLMDLFQVTGHKRNFTLYLIQVAEPTLYYILANTENLDSNTVCGIWYQRINCGVSDPIEHQGLFEVPSPPTSSKQYPKSKTEARLTVVHLTDVHYDPRYAPGANNDCTIRGCCHGELEPNPKKRAGFWGDYNYCDSPWHTIDDTINQVKAQYGQIDMIYFTGDIVDHYDNGYSREYKSHSIRKFYSFLKQKYFNTPIYSVLGNHEATPANEYAPKTIKYENLSTQWLYDLSATEWRNWLPEEALSTVREGGFYTVLVRPELRLIALNNNFCYNNLWLFHSQTYINEYLIWIHDTLAKAREAGEKVHIIAHIPANERSCFKGWAQEYRKIIEQFSDTISAIFNGHSHQDEFNVHYSMQDTSKAYAVAWNGGSGTTFAYINSNFRVYSVDAENYHVLDYDNWVYNLTEANLTPNKPPRWFKNYSFREAYDLQDLSPASLDGLVQRLAKNTTLLTMYWERRIKHSDYRLKNGCDKHCQKTVLCDIVFMEHGDDRKCEELLSLMP